MNPRRGETEIEPDLAGNKNSKQEDIYIYIKKADLLLSGKAIAVGGKQTQASQGNCEVTSVPS